MPFYKFELEIAQPTHVVAERIGAITGDERSWWESLKNGFGFRADTAIQFVGDVTENTFRLRRDISYKNSFLPNIRGRIEPAYPGSRVSVTMQMHPLVTAFMTFWLLGVCAGVVVVFAASDNQRPVSLIPVGMLVFGLALILGGFYPEAFKARRLLEKCIRDGGG